MRNSSRDFHITFIIPTSYPPLSPSPHTNLLQSLRSKSRQNKARLMDLSVVVPAQPSLLLGRPRADGLLDVAAGLLAADHEADLAGGVRRDRRVRVLGDGEYLAAVLLQLRD